MSRVRGTRLLVTRHGLSEHNLRTDVFMGRSPAAHLLPEGQEQARALGRRLARRSDGAEAVQRIVCSSLPRTVETARVVADELAIADVEQEEAFWELNKGEWEGRMPRHDIPTAVQRALDADPFGYRYPGGESYRDVSARVGPAFERWVQRFAGENVLFVLHGDVIRALLYHLLRFPPDKISDFATDPCALTELLHTGGRYHLLRFNDASHLEP